MHLPVAIETMVEMIMRTRLPHLVVVAAVFSACDSSSPTEATSVAQIRATTSFGFCSGYCRTSLEITSDEVVYVKEGWRGEPPVRRTMRLTPSEWRDLARTVDRRAFDTLPAVIGCPDCADAGAEALIVGPEWQDSVTFDYGADLPALQELLDRVRAIRARFES